MPRRRSKPPEPDLFAMAQQLPSRAPEPARVRPVIPSVAAQETTGPVRTLRLDDIAAMAAAWSDADLSRLRDLLEAEWQRRGLTGAAPAPPPAPAPERATAVRQRKPEALAEGLPGAQLKLIQSAAKSGVSARDIARQFGLPVAAVENALKAQRR